MIKICARSTDDGWRTEEVVEKLAAVFIGMKSVVDIRLKSRVNMTVIKFTIENKEDRI